jgi:hypothetical protein
LFGDRFRGPAAQVLVRKLSGALVAELLMEKMQLVVALKDPDFWGFFGWKKMGISPHGLYMLRTSMDYFF